MPTPAWQKMEKMRGNLAFAPGSTTSPTNSSTTTTAAAAATTNGNASAASAAASAPAADGAASPNRSRNPSTSSNASNRSSTASTVAAANAAAASAAAAAEQQRKDKEQKDKERADRERAEREQKDKEQQQQQQRERERAEKEQRDREQREQREREQQQQQREKEQQQQREEAEKREKEEKERKLKQQEAEAEALLAAAAARVDQLHKRKESDQAKAAKRKESDAKRKESDSTGRKPSTTQKQTTPVTQIVVEEHEGRESTVTNPPVVIRQSVAHAQAQALQAAKMRATVVRESIAREINTCANCSCKGNFRFGREEELTGVKLCSKCDHNVLEHSTISQAAFRRDEEERKLKQVTFAEGPRESWASLDNLILYWWKVKEDNPCTAPVEMPRDETLLAGEVVQLTSWMLNVTDRHYAFRFLTEDAKVRMLYMDDRQPPILWWYNILEWDSTKAPTSPASSSDAIARLEAEQEAAAAAAAGGGGGSDISSLVTQVHDPNEDNEYQARQTDSVSQAANGLYVHDDDD